MSFVVASQPVETIMRTRFTLAARAANRSGAPGMWSARWCEYMLPGREIGDLATGGRQGRSEVSPRAFLMPLLPLPRSVSKPLRARPIRIWAAGALRRWHQTFLHDWRSPHP